jgi:hypothetical protein
MTPAVALLFALAAKPCMCIEGSVAATPCAGRPLSEQQRSARREIQARIDRTIAADKAKDVDGATRFDTPDYTVRNLRTIRLDADPARHQLITNITHRELWVQTPAGWMRRHIDELQRGPSYLDGVLRAASRR